MEIPGQNPYIELEASEQLQPGQNFYDQPPFDGVLLQFTEGTNIDISHVRNLLTRLAKGHFFGTDTKRAVIDRFYGEWKNLRQSKLGKEIPNDQMYTYSKALTSIVAGLSEYPYVGEYIYAAFQPGQYRIDGSWVQLKSHWPTPTSYAKWASEKLEREKRLVSYGIEEVFPKDFGQEESVVPTGGNPQARRWRILKASELIPEKR